MQHCYHLLRKKVSDPEVEQLFTDFHLRRNEDGFHYSPERVLSVLIDNHDQIKAIYVSPTELEEPCPEVIDPILRRLGLPPVLDSKSFEDAFGPTEGVTPLEQQYIEPDSPDFNGLIVQYEEEGATAKRVTIIAGSDCGCC